MENLQIDSIGQIVKLLQKRLQELGFYSGEIDGVLNVAIEEAVKAFQEEEGLAADGVVGLATEEALDLDLHPVDLDVEQLQQRLSELDLYQGAIDGVWDQAIIAAVKEFQKVEGLAEDGVVGMTTLEALDI
ncbi:MAG: peptidoglycan-binding protein [Waterburya sp.]